jgi:signal transduction histidine kinase
MKLVGALAVPLIALVIVTALEVYQSADEATEVRDQADLAEGSIGPASLLSRLEDERNAAGVYLLGAEDAFALPVEDNAEARAATDQAIADFREQVQSLGGEVEEAYGPALEATSGLGELRNRIDSFEGTRSFANIQPTIKLFDAYGPLMAPFFQANKQVALAIDNPELRRGAELVDLSSRQTDLIAQLTRDLLLAVIGGDTKLNQPEEVSAVAARLGQLETNKDLINTKATGDYALMAGALFHAQEIRMFPKVVEDALETGEPDIDGVIRYSAGEDPETYGYTVFRTSVTDELTSTADTLESMAADRQRTYIVLAALALGAAVIITWLVSRSITRPLRSLTRQATAMADHRLPEAVLDILDTPLGEDVEVPEVDPVTVHTHDEVADVAEALNTVQDTALDLAVEQAVLRRNIADSFVNLGRRNQNLLGRQLDFITELETNETSPDTLSNLFRLDHLATRMRRNAESLLVLAGVEPPRKWAAPVRLTDVIRAALGEVEDYQRVTVRGVEPATIVGAAAADLAHLLAELIENALVFSPPDQTVDIRGRIRQGVGPQGNGPRALPATMRPDDLSERAHDGDGGRVRHGGYTLAVIDSGLGMTAADMEAANRRLASEESFTIAPSKYLGHYVAGNLALRHGIRVRLDNSPGNGITATVHIPPALLTTDAVTSAPVTPPQGMRPSGVALAARDTALPAPPAPEPPAPWPPDPLPPPAPPWEPIEPAARSYDQEPAAPSRSVFDAPAPADPAPPGWLTEPPPYQPTRTASGLVKRPRPGEGVGAPATAAHASANEDLLASLGRIAGTSRSGEPSGPPAWTAPPPGAAPSDASPRRWPEGVGTGDQRFDPRSTQPTASPLAAPPSSPPSPGPASSPVPPTPPLTRRVKGAQLPAADPMLVRRGAGAARPAAPGPAPRRTMPAAGDGRRSPDDVYSFLTSFTAGVQRGLDETNPPGPDSSPTG